MAKQKFYVVWKGRETGIFESWDKCKEQIHKFPQAEYKSFKTRQLAEEAFRNESADFIGKDIFEATLTEEQLKLLGDPILESISVDGAWNTATGVVECQGIHTRTKKVLFRLGPFEDGTNNIAEFLAIVNGLAYCKTNNLKLPIYSDSTNAIGWVRDKQARTKHNKSDKNIKLFELIDRAIKWLNENEYNNQILKWETRAWGENPADFGRK
ncbi:MAG: ribonuclease H family protein [Chitinophagaceae bacterium]|nr:ribonuclease H family protein [Chitinophagaceae bacterium]